MTQHQSAHEPAPFRGIAIVGFGMVGASMGAAVRAAFPQMEVLAVGRHADELEEAVARGWATQGVLPDDPAFRAFVMERCDLVVLATPADAAAGYFRELSEWGYEGIVTDTASTKAHIVALAQENLARFENYVPGHPMAGSEKNGLAGARVDLFKGAYWILCPDEDTPPDHLPRLHALITGLGARVIVLPREKHDAAVAIVSHVPHITAASLMQLANRHTDEQKALMRLTAGGFKDSTRIAAGSPELWCGIAFDNKDAIVSGLEEMREIIGGFEGALRADDREGFTKLLAESAEARRALPAAWVPSTERLLEVRIPMTDRTGVVAEATTITSSAGCNIQSIEIDHMTEDSAVLSMVLTDEGDFGKLSAGFIEAGFAVSFSPLTAKRD